MSMDTGRINFDLLQDDDKPSLSYTKPQPLNPSLQAFAAANSLKYTAFSAYIGQEKSTMINNPYYSARIHPTIIDMVEGQLKGLNYRLFKFSFLESQGMHNRWRHDCQMIAVDLPRQVPHISLTPRRMKDRALVLSHRFNPGQELDFDPEINAVFKIESPAATEQLARQLFTLPVQRAVKQYAADYAIEFIDDRLYIFAPLFTGTKQEYQRLYACTGAILEVLLPVLQSLPATTGNLPHLKQYEFWRNNAVGFIIIAAVFVVALVVVAIVTSRS